jgi:hypothetical protein
VTLRGGRRKENKELREGENEEGKRAMNFEIKQ